MLEFACGILFVIVVLVCPSPFIMVVLAILSWVFMVGIGGGIVWFLYTYLDLFSASLVVAIVATAIAGFGYWVHRFESHSGQKIGKARVRRPISEAALLNQFSELKSSG